ncbi:MAG: carbohydrate ABC transporter permease [Rectinemataceae bacterium]
MIRENPWRKAFLTMIGVVIGVVWLLPFVGVFVASLRPYAEIVDGWWRTEEFSISLKNYAYVFSGTSIPFLKPLWNSLLSSLLGAVFPALLGSAAAYAFVRHRIPGKTVIIVVLMSLMAIPGQMIAIPAFKRLNAIGLLDTRTGVILMNTVTALPWVIYFMINVIKGLDSGIEEAAKIDGATEYRIFAGIVLPQTGPALISVCLLQFVWSWNSFFWPLIIVFDPAKMMATQVIPMLKGQFITNWGALSAAAVSVMIVPITLFLVFQRYYIQGSVGFEAEK